MAAPFTQEQVTYLEEREKRLGEHGTAWSRSHLRSYSRRALTGFVILLLGLAGAFYAGGQDAQTSRDAIVHSGRYVSVEGCNRDYDSRESLRGLLVRARALVIVQATKGKIPPDQAQTGIDFYNDQLRALPPIDCRPSAASITDNPDNIPSVPEPKHPPDSPYQWEGPH